MNIRESKIGRILNDPSVSFWVKSAFRESVKRDPVDALRDAELLTVMLAENLREIMTER